MGNKQEFIILLQEDTKFGLLAFPYYIKHLNTRYQIEEKLTAEKLEQYNLKTEEIELIKISEKYSEQYLFKLYGKKKATLKNFYEKIDDSKIKNLVIPFVEKNLNKLFAILKDTNIRLFIRHKKETELYDTQEVKHFKAPAEIIFNFHRTETEINYFITINHNQREINLLDKNGTILTNEPCWLLLDYQLLEFKNIDGKKLLPFFNKSHVSISKKFEKKYFEGFILNSIKKYKVHYKGFEIKTYLPSPKFEVTLEKNFDNNPVFIPVFNYEKRKFRLSDTSNQYIWLEEKDGNYCYFRILRDEQWEKSQIAKLSKFGMQLNNTGHFFLDNIADNSEDKISNTINWLNKYEEKLIEKGIVVKQDFYKKKYFTEKISLDINLHDKNDWFDIRGYAIFGAEKVPFIKLRNHILKGIREYKLSNGEIAILPTEWFSQYANIFKFGTKTENGIQLLKFHSNFIQENKSISNYSFLEDYKRLLNRKSEAMASLPEGLNASLRNYQQEGYNWLCQMKEQHFGACLADDMGLGKTLQTISLLLKDKYENHKAIEKPTSKNQQLNLFESKKTAGKTSALLPSLIVVPVSLVHNWLSEIEKFAPELHAMQYIGQSRLNEFGKFNQYDIVITTYGVVRNDVDKLETVEFNYLILDESQVIKNPNSKIYKAIARLQSKYKLVLTGTPIENSLTDLWSQMNFLNHGLLGNLSFFKEEFQKPIENNNEEKQKELNHLIHPFLLRRTKEEVIKELPPINEQTLLCQMTREQQYQYEEEKSKIRNILLQNMRQKGAKKISVEVLKALNTLRQIAIHPYMINEQYKDESGKFNQIVMDLESVIAENHKILIFSSFVKHLNLFEQYFKDKELGYYKLTGDVPEAKRKILINEFNSSKQSSVFLISLKAGGVGLNLTSADYVFIVDPWWNPAAEWQAVSRAHRIGQQKKVFVYRYLTANTVEEKIALLQEKKSKLADLFIHSGKAFQALSEKDIEALFV